jgi:excisionase family DNA binding protein
MTDTAMQILTPKEVAKELKVGEMTILRLLRAGELGGFKVGASWRILRSDLDAYVSQRHNAPV